MLSNYQKRVIRDLCLSFKKGFVTESGEVNFDFSSNCDKARLSFSSGITSIPAPEDIFENSITKLKKEGFSVELAPPKKANCVFMVYSHDSFEYQNCTRWFYGTTVFFKSLFGMKSLEGLYMKSYYEMEYLISSEESVKIVPRLAYYYLKIS